MGFIPWGTMDVCKNVHDHPFYGLDHNGGLTDRLTLPSISDVSTNINNGSVIFNFSKKTH